MNVFVIFIWWHWWKWVEEKCNFIVFSKTAQHRRGVRHVNISLYRRTDQLFKPQMKWVTFLNDYDYSTMLLMETLGAGFHAAAIWTIKPVQTFFQASSPPTHGQQHFLMPSMGQYLPLMLSLIWGWSQSLSTVRYGCWGTNVILSCCAWSARLFKQTVHVHWHPHES